MAVLLLRDIAAKDTRLTNPKKEATVQSIDMFPRPKNYRDKYFQGATQSLVDGSLPRGVSEQLASDIAADLYTIMKDVNLDDAAKNRRKLIIARSQRTVVWAAVMHHISVGGMREVTEDLRAGQSLVDHPRAEALSSDSYYATPESQRHEAHHQFMRANAALWLGACAAFLANSEHSQLWAEYQRVIQNYGALMGREEREAEDILRVGIIENIDSTRHALALRRRAAEARFSSNHLSGLPAVEKDAYAATLTRLAIRDYGEMNNPTGLPLHSVLNCTTPLLKKTVWERYTTNSLRDSAIGLLRYLVLATASDR